ncbi:MAG: DNA polymerase III subunit gamma/tau [Gemmatimonadetes bacterium]|uniref:DNA polymerase III subunit gamma/tau n=1 Tax=Candidatus Kutchimonas denitrificans TaxID=3056748 RepID=A0AAE5CAV5_9BACT|nr:DNA polymerase III subunit gamma/tau [Gemmatimonadota bacterium]NIR74987.1 DNA polymerase III subunit gamma/tau [Candidatus Kutchimonas denitrificans]NIS01570.1 DNA polymerase III subunit gamma/tau [Gemmatimonadota bacterium]NIT67308.1 DNA polymerase III subunit gamma/tau [Gemmatimonadota bacterium]NIU52671.1 DNA polymerase III subunit gamma/tau [Gemmatimonadota bacterium]
MHRPALARLYRPRNFSEIVGQDHVSATLRTAVERGRVAHAYLFCGPRGIGKTTAARVLAMALNCENRGDGEPCGACESCERIWSGRTSLDVVEIDAASNRGVDDARDLRERAMYAPSEESRYKVYIIDEAHMLTREAWNAFLKILEEPPPRVIFVLATTEPGKIFQAAPPILSRCQRFDFHRISTEAIRERLDQVLDAEGVEAEDAALLPIARKADGALRDALSALDQVLAFSGDKVTASDVRQVLGLIEEDLYFELFELLAEKRAADVFGYVERLIDGGYDLEEFYKGVGEALRLLLRARLEGAGSLRFLSDELAARYVEAADRFAAGDLMRMLSGLAELDTDGRFRKSEQQRILIEVLLLKFAMLDRTVELEELLAAVRGSPGSGAGRGGGAGGRGARGMSSDADPGHRSSGSKSSRGSANPAPDPGPGGPADAGPPVGTAAPAEAPPARPGGPLEAARTAWLEMIAAGKILRPGQGIALRAAQIIALLPDGELRVSCPQGTPAAEVLEDKVNRRRIEEELSRRLGRPIRVSRAGSSESLPPRVSQDTARGQKLARLVEEDQGLQDLVDRLDLELID